MYELGKENRHQRISGFTPMLFGKYLKSRLIQVVWFESGMGTIT